MPAGFHVLASYCGFDGEQTKTWGLPSQNILSEKVIQIDVNCGG